LGAFLGAEGGFYLISRAHENPEAAEAAEAAEAGVLVVLAMRPLFCFGG
jgi:hypothetical protein